ncbi:MFS transporter [Chelatococcus asaccharovorans]|uniref:MFS transporter n=1 Tax=Chelatococcus asaccharovorans TaxID=28210 RepID=UPI00224C6FB5|nr:MFS transporter [Chelatococcus asaccharovorans]CAH1665939.1 putative tartrate transporter [Chelatococcus asaccharovorans]CAH1681708.1 putative tartrate transporter [Chelatococcus asaccharovorans]
MNIVDSAAAIPTRAADNLGSIYRKIGFRLIPILMLLWVMAWIDRVNVSFAKLQMMDELRFSDAVYGLGAGIFFIGYLIFEVPSNLLLQKIGARRTIARIAIGWGATCALMALVTTPTAFYALRFLLGAFEAGFFPGVILYLTLWFPSDRRAKVFGIFMSSAALSGVLGGPLAGLIMSALHAHVGLSGWQWLFILEGIPTMLIGVFCLFYLTDKLKDARWLSLEERAAVAADLERDHAVLGDREHHFGSVIRDRRLWAFTAIYFCVIVANATVAFWGPTIIRSAGVADIQTIGWIVSGASLLGSAVMILNGFIADRTGRPLILCILSLLVASVALGTIATFLHTSAVITIVAFAFALAGAYGTIPVFWQMPNRLFAGTAAAGGIAVINSFGNLGGFLAPYGLGLAASETGDVAGGLIAVSLIVVIAVFGIVAARRFFTPGTV